MGRPIQNQGVDTSIGITPPKQLDNTPDEIRFFYTDPDDDEKFPQAVRAFTVDNDILGKGVRLSTGVCFTIRPQEALLLAEWLAAAAKRMAEPGTLPVTQTDQQFNDLLFKLATAETLLSNYRQRVVEQQGEIERLESQISELRSDLEWGRDDGGCEGVIIGSGQ